MVSDIFFLWETSRDLFRYSFSNSYWKPSSIFFKDSSRYFILQEFHLMVIYTFWLGCSICFCINSSWDSFSNYSLSLIHFLRGLHQPFFLKLEFYPGIPAEDLPEIHPAIPSEILLEITLEISLGIFQGILPGISSSISQRFPPVSSSKIPAEIVPGIPDGISPELHFVIDREIILGIHPRVSPKIQIVICGILMRLLQKFQLVFLK